MTQEILAEITCDNCGNTIPKVIRLKEGEEGPDSFELECPFCQTMLQAKLPKGTLLAETEIVLRGLKKL